MFGVMHHLNIEICADGEDAIKRGYHYTKPEYRAIEITKAVVVRRGTQEGNSTVDFIMIDETGQKFVVMVTGNLLKTLAGTL